MATYIVLPDVADAPVQWVSNSAEDPLAAVCELLDEATGPITAAESWGETDWLVLGYDEIEGAENLDTNELAELIDRFEPGSIHKITSDDVYRHRGST